jgi:hypothetical protein
LAVGACASTTATTEAPASPTTTTAGVETEQELIDPNEVEVDPPELTETEPTCEAASSFPATRTDVRRDGNRIAAGAMNLASASAVDIELPGEALWVVPDPATSGGWYVSLDDGRAVRVDAAGAVSDAGAAPAGPPELSESGEALSPYVNQALFEDPLEDSRVVQAGDFAAALANPTDRYGHGVLGDAIEAAAIEWINLCSNERGRIDIPAPDVIEGISPMLADVDGDSELEVLATVSNGDEGARLVSWEFDGTPLAESAPIGRGNRWRNQLAVGPFGPEGQIEVIDVRTPHIGGTLQAFRVTGGNDGVILERVAASDDRYTTHVIGSRNLDMGLALDANADGRLDVVVATSDRRALVALTRTNESQGWTSVAALELPALLTSNLATQTTDDGTALAAAAGTTLRVWK